MAAEKLRTRLFDAATTFYGKLVERSLESWKTRHPDDASEPRWEQLIAPDAFEIAEGNIFLSELPELEWLRIPLGKLLRAAHFTDGGKMFTVEALYDPPSELPDWQKGTGNMSACYSYATQGVEVEVDTDTGDVKILKMVCVSDVGRVLNPATLRGQIYGALAQGVGYALYEQVLTGDGRTLNANFTDYKIPTAVEMGFPIQLEFIETHDETGPYGAKGVGEPGLTPTAPAIANAIHDAVGIRVHDLPITPEKVLNALRKKTQQR
jgi:xanthine dehydrogenase molybdenum-binding subunit